MTSGNLPTTPATSMTDEARREFRSKRHEEALRALRDGKHMYGCEGYAGLYGQCTCLQEIIQGGLNLDSLELENGRPVPWQDPERAVVINWKELPRFTCRRCNQPVTFDVIDTGMLATCRCGMHYRISRLDAIVEWMDGGFPAKHDIDNAT